MDELESYKRAYLQEREARSLAERLLDEKSRELYDNMMRSEAALSLLQKTQAQLLQSEKMASVGQLAAGVAHEINNPVAFVLSNIASLQGYCDALLALDDVVNGHLSELSQTQFYQDYTQFYSEHDIAFIKEDVMGLLAETHNGLVRVREIVASMKRVSHISDGQFSLCDINDCIESALRVVWNQFKYTLTVTKDLPDLPMVNGQFSELQQVFMNLFINAGQACKDRGLLTIVTSVVDERQQSWVKVTVSDDGEGIPEALQAKIFDPFFTTKPVGIGTGLGLSISYGIIEKHRGRICVESTPGQGTTFTILLPVASVAISD